MSLTQLRAVLGGMLWLAAVVVACNKSKAEESLLGPHLGDSTASAPANPSAPPPDAAGPTAVSAAIHTPTSGPNNANARTPDTAANGANSGTVAAPPSGATTAAPDRAPTLPQDRGTTLPQDKTAPPAAPQPGVFSPPPSGGTGSGS